jgi:hypothetical protein
MSARHLRQILLPEIGLGGQLRIDRAIASVGGEGLAHEIATRYAEGAGFSRVAPGPFDEAALAPAAIVSTPEARAVLAGARAALGEIRRAISEDR